MIKQLGLIGFYIKFNESASSSFKFLEIFSSSAATTSLFSASTNNKEYISVSTKSASTYINGTYSPSAYSNEWLHLTFNFDPKLEIDSNNNFLVRFGNTEKTNFNIQNLYMLDTNLSEFEISYLHYELVGSRVAISSGETSSASIKFYDKDELNNSSASVVYQPYPNQLKFKYNIKAVESGSLSEFKTKEFGNRYIDTVIVSQGDRVISLTDKKIYLINNAGSVITEESPSTGDYYYITNGMQYINLGYLYDGSDFQQVPLLEKIVYSQNNFE